MPRHCGTCSACCRWPSVAEIDKPARVACRFLAKQGFRCTIYEDRPKACSDYRCTWLRGMGSAIENRDRPDTCHVLIDRRSTQFGVVLVAKSLTPGAAPMSRKGKRAIERTTRDEGLPLLVINDDEQIIAAAGPPDFMQIVARKGPKLGNQGDHITNIIAAGMEGRVFPGLDHGR